MKLKMLSGVPFCLGLGLGLAFASYGQSVPNTFTAPRATTHALPLAIYRNIGVDQLNKLLVDSFLESNFSLLGAKKSSDGTEFVFSYPIDKGGKSGHVIFKFKVDGTVVNRKCVNCFLRWGHVQDEGSIGKLPWMTQYDLNSNLRPDMDRAYLLVSNKSRAYLDYPLGFDYKNAWAGERNRIPNSNAYVNIKLPDLKRETARAFTESGFVLLRDSNPAADAVDATLAFSFPIDSDKPEGAVYAIRFESQFDSAGLCYPCEAREVYDPHQPLPALGLGAMQGRLTLAPRFEAALGRAYAQVKATTQGYLRPRTQFASPPKTAALGTPRPIIMPVPPT